MTIFLEAYLHPKLLKLQQYMETIGHPEALRDALESGRCNDIEFWLLNICKPRRQPIYVFVGRLFVFQYAPQGEKFWHDVYEGRQPSERRDIHEGPPPGIMNNWGQDLLRAARHEAFVARFGERPEPDLVRTMRVFLDEYDNLPTPRVFDRRQFGHTAGIFGDRGV